LQIRSADFIICASEKQRDFWLGWLAALGRINPYTHQNDPSLAKLIDVVPFGLPKTAPTSDKRVLKGVYKTIDEDDKIILWGGGLWDWLDPQTLIKAVAAITPQHPKVKLFFMGIKSPNPSTAKMNTTTQAIALSRELGVYEKSVFFNDWVPYQERHNYLLEADIGVSLHRNHIETRFSFRTRLLDYIWASLPILATEGDIFSEEIKKHRLGQVVKGEDVADVRRALLELLEIPNPHQHYQSHFDQIRSQYEWEAVTRPLINFCEAPYIAADKPHLKQISLVEPGISSWSGLPGKILETVRNYGLPTLLEKSKEYLRWKLKR
jgi:glycosyltransferase involved in cell wall biosynthesis